MQIVTSISEMMKVSQDWDNKKKVGFVPTMGALHEGHLSLVKESNELCDITVVSIYVNPSQFGPNEDLDKYPKVFEQDKNLLNQYNVDYIFLPTSNEMYPDGYNTWVNVEELTDVLCGGKRPGHFRGVCTIVLKLVNLVRPHFMFMGEKDFQQVAVLETMLRDLHVTTKIVRCKIVRDHDGLALSSRNMYLSKDERQLAPTIYNSLNKAVAEFDTGKLKTLHDFQDFIENILDLSRFKIDYIDIVDSGNLKRQKIVKKGNRLLVAIFLGTTRLIDNIEI
jgi:pantoate--beta-alanine ligase